MRNCEYITPSGKFCGSPALRGRDYCYWHLTCVARRLRAEKQEATQDRSPLELPPLEDANSIQLAIMTVTDAMLRNRIGPRMSGHLLYALQLASCNLKQGVCFQPGKQPAADDQRAEDVTLCSAYDSLEADYDIHEHAEQLKASDANLRLVAAEETEEEEEKQGQQENESEEEQGQQEQLNEEEQALELLSDEEQFRHDLRKRGVPDQYHQGPAYEQGLAQWKKQKQEREEKRRERDEAPRRRKEEQLRREQERRQHWDMIRHDLAEAAASEDTQRLQELLADCYERAGIEYEAEGWKPATPQKVLFPRKPPENVQKEWYEQRKANCSAEFDKIAEREAAQKKIS